MADIDVNQIIAAAQAAAGGASQSVDDLPLIPLWRVRPASQAGNAGSSAAADRNTVPSQGTGAGSAAAADRSIADRGAPPLDPSSNAVTMAAAEGHWMDMSAEERMAFASAAEKAGVWKRSLGADALFQAWGKAVGWAGKYNNLHKDNKRLWMSPFEAITNMQIAGMADDDQSHDGFSTETVIQQFNVSQLTSQARQILQNELGRNPTDSEMKAYTAAVNAAARANPQTRSTQQEIGPDGMPVPGGDSAAVMSGGIDPNQVIQDMAQGTQESDAYKGAAMYLPALRQAIEGAIQL